MVLELECASESLGGLLKQTSGSQPEIFTSLGLEWGLRIPISNKCPRDVAEAALGTALLRTTELKEFILFNRAISFTLTL